MPYSSPSDAPDYIPAGKKAQWVAVWNSVYAAAIADGKSKEDAESTAFAQATSVAKKKKKRTRAARPRIQATIGHLHGEATTTVQCIVFFPKAAWELDDCKEWLRDHDYKATDLDETADSFRFTQRGTDDFVQGSFKTISFEEGRAFPAGSMTMAIVKREVRFLKAAEMRAESQGDEMALVGYAALFNNESKDLGGFRETVAPGAFKRSLAEKADVKALFNHNANSILGRVKNGTLVLAEDERGLHFRVQLNKDSQAHRDLHASVKRGDIDECSFAFTVPEGGQEWSERQDETNKDWFAARKLTDVNLMDVSAVTYPAYDNTSVAARCFPDGVVAEVRAAVDALKNKHVEQRDEDESYEEMICEVQHALNEKFPALEDCSSCYSGQYWVCETHDDYVIVSEAGMGDKGYCKIAYHEDEPTESFIFGTPVPVEKEWVEAVRCKAVKAEYRAAFERSMAALAAQHAQEAAKAEADAKAAQLMADEHASAATAIKAAHDVARKLRFDEGYEGYLEGGDESQDEPIEENQLVDADQVWLEDEGERAAFLAVAENRAADGKVRTKKVGDKNLPYTAFAFVGDKADTSTWKYPVHDANHARNALARWGQHTGIPADKEAGVYRKIVAAAKKFGIEVSKEAERALVSDDEYRETMARRLRFALLA